MKTHWLTYFNLSDEYERKARFLPSVLSLFVLFPLVPAIGTPINDWLSTIISGTGIGAILAVGISHIASAFGNRLQVRIWPRWPYDSPTNQWLHPENRARSEQQKNQWYDTIKHLTDMDIQVTYEANDKQETLLVINDAISQLRYQLWHENGYDRLRIHNIDYGFARNFLGLWPIWLGLTCVTTLICWLSFFFWQGSVTWAILSSMLTIFLIILAKCILPNYLKAKAHQYAETFLSSILDLERTKGSKSLPNS